MALNRIHLRARLALAGALALCAGAARAQQLTIIQLNDVYRIDAVENGAAGGLGRVVTLARQSAAGGAPVMVVHAGDMIAPSLESRYFAGLQMIDALNYLHSVAPLLAIPGNHEFDDRRPAMLANALEASRFRWLAGNVALATGDSAADRRVGRDTVITAPGGLRVGVFTLTFMDSPRDYARADSAFVSDAEAQIRELERRGADVIMGLTHLAHETDRQIARLRRSHPKFVWIAGGHEHFVIHDAGDANNAEITKGASNAREVWRVTLGRRGRAGTVRAEAVPMRGAITVDDGYRQAVEQKWAAALRLKVPFYDQHIGVIDTTVIATEETVRNCESAWGNWLADQMRTAFPTVPTDAAVLNGGALRIDDRFRDTLRWEHLARTFGFPTRVAVVWMNGASVRAMMEHSVSGGRGEGRFLQVSGLKVRFDRTRPEGSRVQDVQIRRGEAWAPVQADSVYAVAVPDYLFGGGDGYDFPHWAVRSIPPGPDVKYLAFEALTAAYAAGRPISPRVEGRLENASPAECAQ